MSQLALEKKCFRFDRIVWMKNWLGAEWISHCTINHLSNSNVWDIFFLEILHVQRTRRKAKREFLFPWKFHYVDDCIRKSNAIATNVSYNKLCRLSFFSLHHLFLHNLNSVHNRCWSVASIGRLFSVVRIWTGKKMMRTQTAQSFVIRVRFWFGNQRQQAKKKV